MIKVFADGEQVILNKVNFSDGAFTYKLELPSTLRYLCINVDTWTKVCDIREEITLVYDSILNSGSHIIELELNIPYLPYARCDRVFEKGNPNSLKVFMEFLESLTGLTRITTCDIHNKDATTSYKLPLYEINQLECFKSSLRYDTKLEYDLVLAPDKGSVDKAKSIADYLGIPIFYCGKERDITTGKIIKSTIPERVNFKGKKVLIPDDICDGGYTFIKLAELLKESGVKIVDLYITHLIASKGLGVFKGFIDEIYYYDIVGQYINSQNVMDFNLNKGEK